MLASIAAAGDKHRAGLDRVFLPSLICALRGEGRGGVGTQYVELIRPEPVAIAGCDHAVHIGLDPLLFVLRLIELFATGSLRRASVVVQADMEAQLVRLFEHSGNVRELRRVVAPHLLAPFLAGAVLRDVIVCYIAAPTVVEHIAVCRISIVAQTVDPLQEFCLRRVVIAVFGEHEAMRPLAIELHTAGDLCILIQDGLEVRTIHKVIIQIALRFKTAALLKERGVFLNGIEEDTISHRTHKERRDDTSVTHGELREVLVIAVEVTPASMIAGTEAEDTAGILGSFHFLDAAGSVVAPIEALIVCILAEQIALQVIHTDAKRALLYADFHFGCADLYHTILFGHGFFHRVPLIFLYHIVLRVLRPITVRSIQRELDTDRARRAEFYANFLPAHLEDQNVSVFRLIGYVTDVCCRRLLRSKGRSPWDDHHGENHDNRQKQAKHFLLSHTCSFLFISDFSAYLDCEKIGYIFSQLLCLNHNLLSPKNQ